uniref:Putative secreted peptide n=1 Tax=Hyalomma excavatum TaxID=257692 RepID=A0A131XM10_9ACAR
MACLHVAVTAVALYLCLSSVAATEEQVRNAAPKATVGQSCDGNGDCAEGLCCFRPTVENGTVCGELGKEGDSCSTDALEENTVKPQPSCRKDEDEAEVTTKAYSPPYDGACPCGDGFTCAPVESENLQKSDVAEIEQRDQEQEQKTTKMCKKAEQLQEQLSKN